MNVFVLQHVHKFSDDNEDVKMIGVYSSRQQAEAAVERLSAKPGFRNAPEVFSIDQYVLDKDHWLDGYITTAGGE